jgi:hypothetical protein
MGVGETLTHWKGKRIYSLSPEYREEGGSDFEYHGGSGQAGNSTLKEHS